MSEEFVLALVVPKDKVDRGVLRDLRNGVLLEKGLKETKELFEGTKLLGTESTAYSEEEEEHKRVVPLAPLLEKALARGKLTTATKDLATTELGSFTVIIVKADADLLRTKAEDLGYACAIDSEVLKERAKETGTYFQGDADLGQTQATVKGTGKRLVAKFTSSHQDDKGARNPYKFLHAPYSRRLEGLLSKRQRLFHGHGHGNDDDDQSVSSVAAAAESPFHSLAVVKLTWRLAVEAVRDDPDVKAHWDDEARDLSRPWGGLASLVECDLCAAFPLHVDSTDGLPGVTRDKIAKLCVDWQAPTVWTKDYEHIVERDVYEYFGVEVAFYFSFLAFYTRSLVGLALCGVLFAVTRRLALPSSLRRTTTTTTFTFEAGTMSSFMVPLTIWLFGMLRSWNDRKARLALRWGCASVLPPNDQGPLTTPKNAKAARPSFKGKPNERDPVTGSTAEPYFPPADRRRVIRQNTFILFLFLVIAGLNVVFCTYLRLVLKKRHFPVLPATVLNAVNVFILNELTMGVATTLADRENHQFDDDYEASIFASVLVFRVVNSFATLFYTAYLKRSLEGKCDQGDDCFKDAGHSTMVFFLVQLTIGNAMECLPALAKLKKVTDHVNAKKKKQRRLSADDDDPEAPASLSETTTEIAARDIERAWQQFKLAESPSIDVLDDYLELVIQFGYCVLFFVAFPTAPLFALANNILEAKVDAVKRISKRRPLPSDAAETVNAYVGAFVFVAAFAVVNNCALAAFEGPFTVADPAALFFKFLVAYGSLGAFVYYFDAQAQGGTFLFGSRGANGLPFDVDLQLKRQAFVLSPDSKLVPELYAPSSSSH